MASSSQDGYDFPDAEQDIPPTATNPDTSCVALEQQHLCTFDLDREVCASFTGPLHSAEVQQQMEGI